MKELLQVENLQKIYSGKAVVNNLSLSIHEGEIVGLLGPNGAGKTTAFYLIVGLIRQNSGKIFFKGKDISSFPIHKRSSMGMGYLSQEPSIFRNLSVEENLLAILETLDLPKKEQEEKLFHLLEELHLTPLRKKKALTLSGGERRRLEITRSLIKEPSLLLLDEPFANVDPITVQEVKKLIFFLKKKNISILITDHNAREIFSVVDRSYLLQKGEVMLAGTVEELTQSEEAKKYYLGEDFRL